VDCWVGHVETWLVDSSLDHFGVFDFVLRR
jgi:hypothetical protein